MGKRYYCDYCERSFTDSANNRKKHINGVLHQKERKKHYDLFKDAATILGEEKAKRPCIRLMQTGYCEFGSDCRYGHLAFHDMFQLEQQVAQEQLKLAPKYQQKVDSSVVDTWVSKVTKRITQEREGPKNAELQALEDSLKVDLWTLPSHLQNISNLPPSLQPPTIDDLLEHYTTWG